MPATIFSGTKVKALKKILNLNDGAEIISSTTDPTLSAVSASIGSILLNETTGAVYRKLDAGSSTNWEIVGTGSEALNYATGNNSTADTALGTGWTTYDDAAATPVDGQGGTVSLTFARSTSSPLHGAGSMLWTPVAAAAGEGAAFTWTQNRRDLAAMMEVKFAYEIGTPASFTEGDVTVWLVSASDSGFTTNLEVVQAVPYKLPKSQGTELFKAVFQSHASNLYYKVLIHQATTATGYTIKLDDFFVGPAVSAPLGVPSTDWTCYTPTVVGFGTVGAMFAYWRRVGDSLQIKGTFQVGTATATAASISLPSGMTYEETSTASIKMYVGELWASEGTQNDLKLGAIPNTGTVLNVTNASGTNNANTSINGNATGIDSGEFIAFKAQVKILGWSSNVQMSDSADTRVIATKYTNNGGQSITADVTNVTFSTSIFDTHAAWGGTSFTAPTSGIYELQGFIEISSNTDIQIKLYVDGIYTSLAGRKSVADSKHAFFGSVKVSAGQVISVRIGSSVTLANSSDAHWIEIKKLSGPSSVAASETVSARYTASGSTSVTNGGEGTIIWDTKDWDTHGGMDTSTGVFTAPVSGIYSVKAYANWSGASFAAGGTAGLKLYKPGTDAWLWYQDNFAATASYALPMGGSDTVRLLAGETCYTNAHQVNNGGTRTVQASGTPHQTYISITKVGNY